MYARVWLASVTVASLRVASQSRTARIAPTAAAIDWKEINLLRKRDQEARRIQRDLKILSATALDFE